MTDRLSVLFTLLLVSACSMGPSKTNNRGEGGKATVKKTTTEPLPPPSKQPTVTDQAFLELMTNECYSCHGYNGANSGNIGDVTDLGNLTSRGLLKRGDLKSRLYLRMLTHDQPMPPRGRLPDAQINIVKAWIEDTSGTAQKTTMAYDFLYSAIKADFDKLDYAAKINTRYFHMVHMLNAGVKPVALEATRDAFFKMINMLSTAEAIKKPTPLDTSSLIYKIDLRDFDMHRPETLYTYMLKNIFPTLPEALKTKWLPETSERFVENYYGARFKEIFEGKGTTSPFIQADTHTFKHGLPIPADKRLRQMTDEMSESAQQLNSGSPIGYGDTPSGERAQSAQCQVEAALRPIGCSLPIPLMKMDWFVAQVSGNMQMRIYYHLSGLDDDSVTLDAALAIDDVEGIIVDNDPNFDPAAWPKDDIVRAGFNNSGVSVNHRLIERVQLDYTPGRPLWRGFEFKSKNTHPRHDIFKYPAGPFFEIGTETEPGFECISLMTQPYTTLPGGQTIRTLRLLDHGLFYPSAMHNGQEPELVKMLKKYAPPSASHNQAIYDEKLDEFAELYGHRDYLRYNASDYIAQHGVLPVRYVDELGGTVRMQSCETGDPSFAFRHESLEYFFLRRNGMPGFVNLSLTADHQDYKVPNQRARENKDVLLIPAHDRPELMVVGAPISCLSCHAKGYIEKEDQVAAYVQDSNLSTDIKDKVAKLHKPFSELQAQMQKDNAVFYKALRELGLEPVEAEPVVANYRNWVSELGLGDVAAELYLTPSELREEIGEKPKVKEVLRELLIPGSTMRRGDFEMHSYDLMCRIHHSCVPFAKPYAIPAQ